MGNPKESAPAKAKAYHKPLGKVGGILRTPKTQWDVAKRHTEYTVRELECIRKVRVTGPGAEVFEDHYYVEWCEEDAANTRGFLMWHRC